MHSKIFCNVPWYELQIYWDGSLGICCQEDHKLYTDNKYNIANMTIAEWFNSEPVLNFRASILQDKPLSVCRRCYHEESRGGISRRLKANQKSVIFVEAFADSFAQSPGRKHFKPGPTETHPIDIHIDLGNYCNLACKMCSPRASSKIASQQVQWGIESSRTYLKSDWTRDQAVWSSFKQQLLEIPGLNNIHFMGGETLLTDRFEDLVDHLLLHKRTEVCFSFVTNGTVFKQELMHKLKQFRRVGIEVSIECLSDSNAYQRQGTDTKLVLENLEKYKQFNNGENITVTLRPAISLLTIGSYAGLLDYAMSNNFIVKSLLVSQPRFLDVAILPADIKQQYKKQFDHLLYLTKNLSADYNASDPHEINTIVGHQVNQCLNMLSLPTPSDSEVQLSALVEHCKKWDAVYGYNARTLYPELTEIWNRYGY